jgi:hypothetical protein
MDCDAGEAAHKECPDADGDRGKSGAAPEHALEFGISAAPIKRLRPLSDVPHSGIDRADLY